jgi:glutaminyl-peptide cyclotransferase
MKKLLFACIAITALWACNGSDTSSGNGGNGTTVAETPRIGFSVTNTYLHDTSFFTEGFEFHEGQLFESSGSGNSGDDQPAYPSAFGILNLKTGKVDRKVELDNKTFFGEGITVFKDKIYQLTWKNKTGFIYDAKTFKKLQEFNYDGEGWSLTHDSTRLIMSDGSSNIRFLDPNTLRVLGILGVTDNNGPVGSINELEFVNGYIYANQWGSSYILKIDPGSGHVTGKMDLTNLENEAKRKYAESKEMNGIAWNPASNTLYITGKCWPTVYEIKLD